MALCPKQTQVYDLQPRKSLCQIRLIAASHQGTRQTPRISGLLHVISPPNKGLPATAKLFVAVTRSFQGIFLLRNVTEVCPCSSIFHECHGVLETEHPDT